jgi:hypothetical protein
LQSGSLQTRKYGARISDPPHAGQTGERAARLMPRRAILRDSSARSNSPRANCTAERHRVDPRGCGFGFGLPPQIGDATRGIAAMARDVTRACRSDLLIAVFLVGVVDEVAHLRRAFSSRLAMSGTGTPSRCSARASSCQAVDALTRRLHCQRWRARRPCRGQSIRRNCRAAHQPERRICRRLVYPRPLHGTDRGTCHQHRCRQHLAAH